MRVVVKLGKVFFGETDRDKLFAAAHLLFAPMGWWNWPQLYFHFNSLHKKDTFHPKRNISGSWNDFYRTKGCWSGLLALYFCQKNLLSFTYLKWCLGLTTPLLPQSSFFKAARVYNVLSYFLLTKSCFSLCLLINPKN